MAYKRQQAWRAMEGIPSAPLIGEQLTSVDFDFMKTKAVLSKEIPLLTPAELAAGPQKKLLDQSIVGQIMIAGFHNAATEIRELIREDIKERQIARDKKKYISKLTPLPLRDDIQKLKLLSEVFCELEKFASERQWKKVIILRLELAEALQKGGDSPLAERITNSCFRFLSQLSESIPEDRVIITEVHLTKAYFLMMGSDVNLSDLHAHLQKSFQMLNDHKDKKMYSVMSHKGSPKREGTIRIPIERPIAQHGWLNYGKAATVYEIITLRNTSLYRMGCIISTLSLLKDVDQHAGPSSSSISVNASQHSQIHQVSQQSYADAITFAIEGENSSCLFHTMYSFGTYLKNQGLYSKAYNVFCQLESKSQHLNDLETLGVAYNRLGVISKYKLQIQEAMEHFYEQWEIGHIFDKPILRIDSFMELGMLLLKEGHVVEAEKLSEEAYDELRDVIKHIQQSEQTSKKQSKVNIEKSIPVNDFKHDNILEKAWVMAGLVSGHQRWARFAGQCRNRRLYTITSWQTGRTPLPPVVNNRGHRFIKISSCKKHHDLDYLSKRVDKQLEMENIYDNQELKTGDNWLQRLDDDENFEFVHDKQCEEKSEITMIPSTDTENFDILDSEEVDENQKERRSTYLGIANILQEIYSRQRSHAEKYGHEIFKRPTPESIELRVSSSSPQQTSEDKSIHNEHQISGQVSNSSTQIIYSKKIHEIHEDGENDEEEEEDGEELESGEEGSEEGSGESSTPTPIAITTGTENCECEESEGICDCSCIESEFELEVNEKSNMDLVVPEDGEDYPEDGEDYPAYTNEGGSSNHFILSQEIENQENPVTL